MNIGLRRCTDKPSCKNETEIDDFIDKHGSLQLYFNNVNYQTEKYSEEVLDKYLTYLNWPIRSTDNH